MIGMFKREGDVSTFPEFNGVAIAGLVAALGAYGAGFAPAAFLISSVACLLGIGALKEVQTAATGNWVGLLGVVGAVAATMAQIGLGGGLAQAALTYGGVGLSAVASAVGDFMLHGASSMLPSVYAAALIGSLTVSGSLVAFAKLQGLMGGGSLQSPGQKILNAALVAGSLALGAQFMAQATLAPLLAGTAAFFVP